MKKVNNIPAIERSEPKRDPWIDALLDGELRQLEPSDWQGRYKTPRSGASAIKEAGVKRGIDVTTAVRGDSLYVQAMLAGTAGNGQRPTSKVGKAPSKKAAVKKAVPRKAAAKKAASPK